MSDSEAFWLGITQGLTEFLPVSSSGHLVMLQTLLGVEGESGLLFEVGVHVATLFAIVLFFRHRIFELIRGVLRGQRESWEYGAKLAVGTLPAVVVALAAKDFIEAQFAEPAMAALCLLVTGGILWTTRYTLPKAQLEAPSWGAALLIGCAQAFAILPGISRSGTTVATALALGVRPMAAAEFSFLLGIIAIAGAGAMVASDALGASTELLGSLAVGGVAALVSGIAAIWLFIRFLERRTFHVFAYYAWAVGGLFLAWLGLR